MLFAMRRLLLALLLVVSTTAFGQTIRLSPESPETGQPFEVAISGFWPTPSVPTVREVFLTNNQIIITLGVDPGADPIATPFVARASITGLAAGTYVIRVRLFEGSVLKPYGSSQVTVRGTASMIDAVPDVGGTAGGMRVMILCPDSVCAGAQVFFGDKPAESVSNVPFALEAITPAHAPGPVDLRVVAGGTTMIRQSGFTFVSPNEYDTFLLPSFTGRVIPGAFGSEWLVDHGIYNGNEVDLQPNVDFLHVFRQCQVLCPAIPAVPAKQVTGIPTSEPYTQSANWMIHVRRPASEAVRFSMRVRDRSRQDQTWGTELPIVRERDFATRVQLFDVPLQPRFRQVLRVYALPEGRATGNEITVRFFDVQTGTLLLTRAVTLRPPDHSYGAPELPVQPETVEIDFLGGIPELAGHDRVRVELESTRRIWGYVSVTNNETQHVTVVSPQ